MARVWPALDIHVPGCDPQLQELVLAELDDFQPTAIEEPDQRPALRAFFIDADHRDRAARALGAAFGSHVFVEPLDVDDEDWAARSQASLRAVTVGRLTIAPPWDIPQTKGSDPIFTFSEREMDQTQVVSKNVKIGSDPLLVVIQPSMGFGTGHHATTRLMLKALQALEVRDRTVLDIGCGSGVLAIAGTRLGARSALGIDIDPDALSSAAENVELNRVGDRVRLTEGDFVTIKTRAAIVLANLTGGLLERYAEALAGLVEPGGHLVASGFMESETSVVPALEALLTSQSADREDEWCCVVLRKPEVQSPTSPVPT